MLQRKTILGGLVAVAVACILALTLNTVILGLFGQESTDRAEHSLVGILLLLGVVVTSTHNWDKPGEAVGVVALALAPCYLGTVFPDWDIRLLGIGAHRNPLFHSSLSFLALRLLVGSQMRLPHILIAGYGVGLASHLWWDIVAFGDVRWLPGSALDRLWLGIHGLLCLVPSIPPLRRGGSPRHSGAA